MSGVVSLMPMGKETLVSIEQVAGWASGFRKGEKSCMRARIIQPCGCQVCFYKLCENSLAASHEISNTRETILIK